LDTAKEILPKTFEIFRTRSELNHKNFQLPLDWNSDFDIPKLLEEKGGIVKISNFLPEYVF
jgi:hypothetical protein